MQLDHFFAFGSPMGLFVAMNEHESMMTKDHMSAESFLPSCVCKRIHNLHHPSDPIVSDIYMKLYSGTSDKVHSAHSP